MVAEYIGWDAMSFNDSFGVTGSAPVTCTGMETRPETALVVADVVLGGPDGGLKPWRSRAQEATVVFHRPG